MKKSKKDLSRRNLYDYKELELLVKGILSIKNKQECISYLRAILSNQEIRKVSRRFKIAELLCQGYSFNEILFALDDTGVNTITRVNQRLAGSTILEEIINRINR